MEEKKLTRKDIYRIAEVAIKMDSKDLDTIIQLLDFVSIHELKNIFQTQKEIREERESK